MFPGLFIFNPLTTNFLVTIVIYNWLMVINNLTNNSFR